MASKFRLAAGFAQSVQVRRDAIKAAAVAGMQAAMEQAEKDAQQLYRWHRPGEYTHQDSLGDTWTWTVTGATAASITAYVVPNKRLKEGPGQLTYVDREVDLGNGHSYTKHYPHSHETDPSVTGDYSEQAGVVQGVVTMYTHYAPFLQLKEINGAVWGSPSQGEPVTVEVLSVNWTPVYVPIIRRTMDARMRRYGN